MLLFLYTYSESVDADILLLRTSRCSWIAAPVVAADADADADADDSITTSNWRWVDDTICFDLQGSYHLVVNLFLYLFFRYYKKQIYRERKYYILIHINVRNA